MLNKYLLTVFDKLHATNFAALLVSSRITHDALEFLERFGIYSKVALDLTFLACRSTAHRFLAPTHSGVKSSPVLAGAVSALGCLVECA